MVRLTNKEIKAMNFKCIVCKSGNSGHIIVPAEWIGKEVDVHVVVLD